jgi:5-methylcytosine-specific restriction endonuclease McrA
MTNNRQVICAGCNSMYYIPQTKFYRNKRWCQDDLCKQVIDSKVKNANYKKAQKKIENGTFRHGVESELREKIKLRDDFTCRLCVTKMETNVLQVHHIIPVSNGGDDELSNLVLLCHNCHTSLHKDDWQNYTNKLFDYTRSLSI